MPTLTHKYNVHYTYNVLGVFQIFNMILFLLEQK
jgi:hypothetical protein